MTTQQLVLSLVLATMVFAVALELHPSDFARVARMPRAVLCGLLPQFLLLPVATWLATLALDLPPATEAAMILVACCPGGSLSNVVTHFGRGNTALSVSLSAVAALLALFLTPGMLFGRLRPDLTERVRRPLARFSLLALGAFIVLGLVRERHLLGAQILPQFTVVVLHNAAGLALGWLAAQAFRVSTADRRAVMIEGGMQNAGLALGIIAVQFDADLGMVVVASLWGIWHIVSGMSLAWWWRQRDARHAH